MLASKRYVDNELSQIREDVLEAQRCVDERIWQQVKLNWDLKDIETQIERLERKLDRLCAYLDVVEVKTPATTVYKKREKHT